LRDVVALADVVEIAGLDHQVMDADLAGLDEGDAVVARIDVEEIRRERLGEVVAEVEAQDVLIERQDVADLLAVEHGVAHAERAGAEAGDGAAGLERVGGGLGAVENLEPVAGGVLQHDQVADLALLGERAGAARKRNLVAFEIGGVGVERGGVRHLPAEEARRVAGVLVHHQALLLVVHAERGGAPALVHQLHAEEPFGVGRPVLQVFGAKADVAECLQAHRGSLCCKIPYRE
jgi:hypothetical protein